MHLWALCAPSGRVFLLIYWRAATSTDQALYSREGDI